MSRILVTQRLVLRLMEAGDEASLELLDGDPRVRAFFPGGTANRPLSLRRIEESRASYASNGFCDFIVESGHSGEFMGRAGFKRMPGGEIEIGYLFLPQHWGQGFAVEAVRALLDWFPAELATRVIAYAPLAHRASHRVMEKAGMTWLKEDVASGVLCKFYEAPKK